MKLRRKCQGFPCTLGSHTGTASSFVSISQQDGACESKDEPMLIDHLPESTVRPGLAPDGVPSVGLDERAMTSPLL